MESETETRRQRLRRELKADVVVSARNQLADGGPAAVSWRGIARSVGVNPASLYTYFDNLDDVFTAVILDSFERLGAALQAAAADLSTERPRHRLAQLALTYRQWAIDHTAEFNLIFTDQLPGYAAPPDGPTVAVQSTIFGPFAAALSDLAGSGLDPMPLSPNAMIGEATDVDDLTAPIGLWATMHGLVMLEINHHLPFVDEPQHLFSQAMDSALSGWRT